MFAPSVSVIGLGRLGLPIAALFSANGIDVRGYDREKERLTAVENRKSPFPEPGLQELIERGNILACNTVKEVFDGADFVFLVLPTPSNFDGSFSAEGVVDCANLLGRELKSASQRTVFVVVSTVMPGDTGGIIQQSLERSSGLECGKDFGLCYNPSFVALGSTCQNLQDPPMILLGESDALSGDAVAALWQKVTKSTPPVKRSNLVTAEVSKLALNGYLTTKISFGNWLGGLCSKIPGADAHQVTSIIGTDDRIGSQFLTPGLSYGGPCFPRDTSALKYLSSQNGQCAGLFDAVEKINEDSQSRLTELVQSRITNTKKNVGIIGLGYKPGAYSIEPSAGIDLIERLSSSAASIFVFDRLLGDKPFADKLNVCVCRSIENLIEQSDIIIPTTLTEEELSSTLDFLAKFESSKLIVDPSGRFSSMSLPEHIQIIPLNAYYPRELQDETTVEDHIMVKVLGERIIKVHPDTLRYGGSWYGNLVAGSYSKKIQFWGDETFDDTLEWLTNLTDGVFLDIGAGAGSLALSLSSSSNSKCYAFEAHPLLFNLLEENIRLNNLASLVKALPYAILERSGFTELLIPENPFDYSYTTTEVTGRLPHKTKLDVVCISLDEISNLLCLKKLSLVRIDTEGSELKVLRGGRQVLSKFHPRILLNSTAPSRAVGNFTISDCEAELDHMGYSLKKEVGNAYMYERGTMKIRAKKSVPKTDTKILTIPYSGSRHIEKLQVDALNSWKECIPGCHVTTFGNTESAKRIALDAEVDIESSFKVNIFNSPTIVGVMERSNELLSAQCTILLEPYVKLSPGFYEALLAIRSQFNSFLLFAESTALDDSVVLLAYVGDVFPFLDLIPECSTKGESGYLALIAAAYFRNIPVIKFEGVEVTSVLNPGIKLGVESLVNREKLYNQDLVKNSLPKLLRQKAPYFYKHGQLKEESDPTFKACYFEFLKQWPENVQTYVALCIQRKESRAAIETLTALNEAFPEIAGIPTTIAISYIKEGKLAEAKKMASRELAGSDYHYEAQKILEL